MNRPAIFLPVIPLLVLPFIVFAQTAPFQYSQQGIVSCQGGGAAQSIGSQSATAGVYVPVADATVELNTGILVYKECILRQIVKRMAESATSAFEGQMVNSVNSGRQGNAQFVRNEGREVGLVRDQGEYYGVQAAQNAVDPTLRNTVSATIRNYLASTQRPENILTCPYQGNDLAAFSRAQRGTFSFEGLAASGDPACNSLGLFSLFRERAGTVAATAVQFQENDWNRNNSFYSKADKIYDPLAANILTPGIVIQQSFQQVLGSGFRQLENANDVGQIVGALFAGITNQVVSNSQGLMGLNQSVGGQPSYLSQITSQSSSGLIGSLVNAALDRLNAIRALEAAYLQTLNAIIQTLGQTTTQLQNMENQCWNLIIPAVQTYATEHSITLAIATSTQFSQAIVGTQIAPLQTIATARATTSQQTLQKIDGLITAITSTTGAAQQAAIQTVDTLISQGAFHNSQDLSAVRVQQQGVFDAMATLVQNTTTLWSENTDPSIGWCNTGNPAVIQMWAQKWTH